MLDIRNLADQILENCDIADSQHAGLYSICGLALRLRDLYKWEKRLDPWIEKDSSEVLEWIGEKEQVWDAVSEKKFNRIRILNRTYDPFDARGINAVLESHGILYGGGFAHRLKPTFFLAAIKDKKAINGYPVYILGRELARDLLTLPALTQDNCILVRQAAARLFFWDRMFYINKSGKAALNFALENYGLEKQNSEALHRNLERILESEKENKNMMISGLKMR